MSKFEITYKFILFWLFIVAFGFLLVVNNRTEKSYIQTEKIGNSIDTIKYNNSIAIFTINKLQNTLERSKNELRILQVEKDSILLNFKRKNAKDWYNLQQIKKEQKEINKTLKALRILNLKYE